MNELEFSMENFYGDNFFFWKGVVTMKGVSGCTGCNGECVST